MSLRERIGVAPLAPDRLDRLEQRLVRLAPEALARPARPPWWPWALAATSAAAAAFALVAIRRPEPTAAVVPVEVSTLDPGARIDLGDVVVQATTETRFTVTRPRGAVVVQLDGGTVTLDVEPRGGRPPLWVHASEVRVRVIGTSFSVRHERATAHVEVAVAHGIVEVHRHGNLQQIRGGEQWSSTDGVVLAAIGDSPSLSPSTSAPPSPTAAAPPDTLPLSPDHDIALLDKRRATVVPPPRKGRSAAPGAGARPSSSSVKPRHQLPLSPAPPFDDLQAEIMSIALAPALPTAAATPADAAADYQRRFLSSRGTEASASLYALARTQHAQLGKDAEATRTLDAYLRRFPQGGELEAVHWLRLRILCHGEFDEPCRVAAHSYVSRYPNTHRGTLAKRVTDT